MHPNYLPHCAALLGTLVLAACGSQPSATAAPATLPPTVPATAPAVVQTDLADTPIAEPTATTAVDNAAVSFSVDVLPMLQSRCGSCHGGQRTEEGLNLRSYDAVIAGSENGAVVVPGDAANSKLATMVSEGEMPKRGPKLTPVQVQLIIDWINAGALNN